MVLVCTSFAMMIFRTYVAHANHAHLIVGVVYLRYNEVLFIIDTCQAASMYEHFYSPNILAIASSLVGEDSLSVSYVIFAQSENSLQGAVDES